MQRPGHEADHSLLSGAVIKNDWQRFPNYVPRNVGVFREKVEQKIYTLNLNLAYLLIV
jgi:hypothetical protein